ncbi:exosporium protein C [Bacillus sp. EB106-08-02-XG196]|uniref:exosporium protein C n=1 Tax=Bacillus sp. EB106-08-02-XG196 TaxID=2737049 RepID=UPI0015C43B5D|nr:exosporium protein C [Bacillus sp. EB106-08-02-XG196]NWQ42663.1 exosporium protein C [Bacillus sp. EB106-08-02-XG196]
MANVILDYKASVPNNTFGGTEAVTIPQIPNQLQVAGLGMFLSELTPSAESNRVYLSADVGINSQLGSVFNNAVFFRIYRDGVEIFNTVVGLQNTPTLPAHDYNVTLSTIDEGVPFGFHVYQLTVQAVVANSNPPFFTIAQVVGPVSFSGLAVGTT